MTMTQEHKSKPGAVPLKRTPKQARAAAKARARAKEAAELAAAADAAKQQAARLAQIVNLHIAGFSLSEIGASIGASAEEVDRLLTNETARYVRTQPALRTYVRNYISGKFTEMIEADWDAATEVDHPKKLEHQDRVMRMLDRMARLHGADAPVQSEVKVDAAPEAVEQMVKVLAAARGVEYDTDVFDDVVDAEVVHDMATAMVDESTKALEAASDAVEYDDGTEEF